ncbi:MAG: CPBP family intramembrane metalloprotease [Planctomycetes bacterium]|nr:CPBP family intramembrane metalloprotease [Planctomycetota bacterium]
MPGETKFQTYVKQSRDPLNSLVLTLPILLLYNVGLLISGGGTLNGVDFITVFLLKNWGMSGMMAFNGGLFVTLVLAVLILKREKRLEPAIVFPIIVESTVYAVGMGSLILLLMTYIPGLNAAPPTVGLLDRIFISMGAGFHEELVFRLVLFGGLSWAIGRLTEKPELGIVIGLVVSSLLFSLVHYLGAEAFALNTFVYRALAGAVLVGLYYWRGFAVAVYTHAIYDVYVLVWREIF